MNLEPRNNRLIVKRDATSDRTASGLFVPTAEKKMTGVVTATGTSEDNDDHIAEGEHVLFGKYAGTEFEWEGQKYLLLESKDIIAVIKGK